MTELIEALFPERESLLPSGGVTLTGYVGGRPLVMTVAHEAVVKQMGRSSANQDERNLWALHNAAAFAEIAARKHATGKVEPFGRLHRNGLRIDLVSEDLEESGLRFENVHSTVEHGAAFR